MTPNGPAIWRACPASAGTERKEIALQAILAKEPACRGVVLPDVIPAKADPLNRAVIYHWPEKEGMPCPDEAKRRRGRTFCKSWYKLY
jgi:hypothetical protein